MVFSKKICANCHHSRYEHPQGKECIKTGNFDVRICDCKEFVKPERMK